MRFDTRFFIAALPEGQVPLATSYEVAHSLWLTPERAMKLFADKELPMIFPTFAALRTLADFQTLESVFQEFRRHCDWPTHAVSLYAHCNRSPHSVTFVVAHAVVPPRDFPIPE